MSVSDGALINLAKEIKRLRDQIEAGKKLAMALKLLHDDTLEYLTINKIGGENNHAMKLARETLSEYAAIAKGE